MVFVAALLLAAPPATPTPVAMPTPAAMVLRGMESFGTSPGTPDSLAAAAKKIRLRLPADQPRVINNDTVKKLAEGVELTTATGRPATAAPTAAPGGSPEAKKAMWQHRYVAARVRVGRLQAVIARLQSEVNLLQTKFYATDDPAQRDGIVKPAWDRALANLKQAQDELERARGEPDKILDAASADGALPGWFRGLDDEIRDLVNEPDRPMPTETPPREPVRERSRPPKD